MAEEHLVPCDPRSGAPIGAHDRRDAGRRSVEHLLPSLATLRYDENGLPGRRRNRAGRNTTGISAVRFERHLGDFDLPPDADREHRMRGPEERLNLGVGAHPGRET